MKKVDTKAPAQPGNILEFTVMNELKANFLSRLTYQEYPDMSGSSPLQNVSSAQQYPFKFLSFQYDGSL